MTARGDDEGQALAELLVAWRADVDEDPVEPMPRVQALLDQLEAAA